MFGKVFEKVLGGYVYEKDIWKKYDRTYAYIYIYIYVCVHMYVLSYCPTFLYMFVPRAHF